MKVRLVTRVPGQALFVVSRPVDYEEMEPLAAEATSNMAALIGKGDLTVVTADTLVELLCPTEKRGMLVSLFLGQEEMQERRGMARLFGVGRPRRQKRRR